MAIFGLLDRVVWWKFTGVLEELSAAMIRAMMQAASIPKMSVSFY